MEQQNFQLMIAGVLRYNMFFRDVMIKVPLKLTPVTRFLKIRKFGSKKSCSQKSNQSNDESMTNFLVTPFI